ncbi:hypothetical protein DOY81_000490 [Sarcophaga bullata]|nr:hypothetical protein DOY81_000490 [Sarcophaga bullata]
MYSFVQFGLLSIIAMVVKAAPLAQQPSGSNNSVHHGGEPNGIDNKHKDINVILGFFNGIEATARDGVEVLVRKIQSIVQPNLDFHDGRLQTLLRDLGLVEIKNFDEFKNTLQAYQRGNRFQHVLG